MRCACLLCPVLLIATLAGAQTGPLVLPHHSLDTNAGTDNNNLPFSWAGCRYQQVFNNGDMGPAATWRFLQLRPARNWALPAYGGRMVNLEIKVGTTAVDERTCTADFAVNLPAPVTVVGRRWLQLPRFRPGGFADWQVTLPFDRPYAWPGGTHHFCLEVVNRGISGGGSVFTYPLDAVDNRYKVLPRTTRIYTQGDPQAARGLVSRNYGLVMRLLPATVEGGWLRLYGKPCLGSGGAPQHTAPDCPRLNAAYTSRVAPVPPGAGCLYLLGRYDDRFGSQPLPLELSPFGAPGCVLLAEGLFLLPAVADVTGAATITLTFPGDLHLLGLRLRSQWLAIDAGANTLGVVTSAAGELSLGR